MNARNDLVVSTLSAVGVLVTIIAQPALSASDVADAKVQSLAAFETMATTIASPRCQGCHTLSAFPRQGDDQHRHRFNVMRGSDDRGAAGLPCTTCHGKSNNLISGVPGADDDWRLAPTGMGWEGLSAGEICRRLKDPAHNGNRSGAQVIDHLRTHLVQWAWAPGTDAQGRARTTPPIAYGDFIDAAATWLRTGAACP